MSHCISVSPEYPKMLLRRYPTMRKDNFTVLPFGAPEQDFEFLASLEAHQTIFDPQDGKRHWVYVGRAAGDMAVALRILFSALSSARKESPARWEDVRLHFVGSSYAMGNRVVHAVKPLAQDYGVADLVEEHAQRIPYFEALKVLKDSHAILLIGSDDPSYTASKLYPCILARKPILGIFHERSSVVDILCRCNAGKMVTFSSIDDNRHQRQQTIAHLNWLLSLPEAYTPETNWLAFEPFTAREMTRKQCEIFNGCLKEVGRG